jgi:hypothetical protein
MFLITVRHQVLGTDPALLPSKKFHKANLDDLVEWCQAFERACANAGFLRQREDLMASMFIDASNVRLDLRKRNLAPRMVLHRSRHHKDIVIEIENLDDTDAAKAAASFVR